MRVHDVKPEAHSTHPGPPAAVRDATRCVRPPARLCNAPTEAPAGAAASPPQGEPRVPRLPTPRRSHLRGAGRCCPHLPSRPADRGGPPRALLALSAKYLSRRREPRGHLELPVRPGATCSRCPSAARSPPSPLRLPRQGGGTRGRHGEEEEKQVETLPPRSLRPGVNRLLCHRLPRNTTTNTAERGVRGGYGPKAGGGGGGGLPQLPPTCSLHGSRPKRRSEIKPKHTRHNTNKGRSK